MSTMGIVKLKQTSTWVLIIKFQKTVGKEKTVTTHLCNCIDQNIYLKYGTCIYCGSPSFSAFLKSNPQQSIVSKNGRKNLELLDLAAKVFHLPTFSNYWTLLLRYSIYYILKLLDLAAKVFHLLHSQTIGPCC